MEWTNIYELCLESNYILNEKEIKGLKKVIKIALKYELKDIIITVIDYEIMKKVFKYYKISELKKLLNLSKKCNNIKYYVGHTNELEFCVYDNLRDLIEMLIPHNIDENKQEEYWNLIPIIE